jgi:uncharacterized protein (DUF983 family)
MRPSPDPAAAPLVENVRVACVMLWRALRLRCPECGVSPVFVPVRRTRSWHDWVKPLDGCPRCGYAYDREDGYFLLAIWGVHYFTVAGFGLALGLLLQVLYRPPLGRLAWGVSAATAVFAVLFVRHAKSIYLAVDHFFDPHVRGPATTPPPTTTPGVADERATQTRTDEGGHEGSQDE